MFKNKVTFFSGKPCLIIILYTVVHTYIVCMHWSCARTHITMVQTIDITMLPFCDLADYNNFDYDNFDYESFDCGSFDHESSDYQQC